MLEFQSYLALMKSANWKAPGPDGVQGYYPKYAECTYEHFAKICKGWISNPEVMPDDWYEGITYLVHKGGDSTDPKNYRPITCLNTVTNAFTTLLRMIIMDQPRQNKFRKTISPCQFGNRKCSFGAKEALFQNIMIMDILRQQKRSFIQIYYDVSKAYDSINHDWLIQTLKFYNIHEDVIHVISIRLKNWTLTIKKAMCARWMWAIIPMRT